MVIKYMSTQKTITQEQKDILLQRARSGDQAAIEDLAYVYGRPLYNVCRKYVRNEADANDILQNSWIKIIKNIANQDPNKEFVNWCETIIRRTADDFYSRAVEANSVVFTDLGNEEAGLEYDPEDESIDYRPDLKLDEDERRRIVLNILDSLPDDQRIVIMMHYYDDFSLKDIASKLNVPMSSVTGRYARAKKAIKAKVSDMQKRDGIRLYGLSPFAFFLYLLRFENNAGSIAAGSAAVAGGAGSAAASASGSATGTAASVGTKAAAGVATKTAGSIVTAGRIAGTIAIAAGASAYPIYRAVTTPKGPISVNVADYINVSISGYDHYGYASAEIADTGDTTLNEILSSGYCTVSNSGSLTNGTYAHTSCKFDAEAALETGYEIGGFEKDVLVEGLPSTQQIDLFDGVTVTWEVDSEAHTATPVVAAPDTYGDNVSYTIRKSDLEGNVVVHASADLAVLHRDGYDIAGNQLDKAYSIGHAPETFLDEKTECLNSGGEWSKTAKTCIMPAPAENGITGSITIVQDQPVHVETMTDQGQAIVNAAYAQLGSTDLCSLVVNNALNAIGVDCFVGSPTAGYYIDTETIRTRGYWVESPQPGDVAYYSSNYSGNSSHVAIYIGNGKVISGNFNGSTQIVDAYIGGQQSYPQYYRYY